MKRFLFGVLALWLCVAAWIGVTLMLRSCDKPPPPPPPPFSCETLQARVQKCEQRLITAVGDFVEWYSKREGHSGPAAAGRRMLAQGFLPGAIREQQVKRYCTRFQGSRVPRIRRLWGELQRCWPKRGCKAFVGCLKGVAEVEAKAGRIPL